ncbi:putative SOS response-associated peptidase YedK [Pseudomonas sp. JUb42]|uniref:SOS response-associated peptidase family protein n=1 Tax=Pseudomonas sp. JUb42 TaxID=2940611 RepID=UPI0038F77A98|nr:putative SOS response-associated peptidase YedK [Pseudomonas sp. JUb42]
MFQESFLKAEASGPRPGAFKRVVRVGKGSDDPKKKQSYYIKLKSNEPMYFDALTLAHADLEPNDWDGFVIITDASNAGIVDIHDRRPVVFSLQDTREWLLPGLSAERAIELTRHSRPVEDFELFSVGREVGNVKNQGPELIMPLN